MSNALTFFNQPASNLPAHIGSFLDQASNIVDRSSVPSLSYQGKVWATNVNGERTKLMRRDTEGEEVPVSVMRVVILAYGARRSRAYYEGSYDSENTSAPKCWSDDGIAPHANVTEKPSKTCASCAFSAKGSRVTDNGKASVACSQNRMLAIVPAANLDFTPLRLKLAITSDYDAKSPEHAAQGWFAFSQFTDLLRSRGVKHTAALVVKMKFDGDAEYPKVLFSPDRWLTPEELSKIEPLVSDESVLSLLKSSYTPAAGEPVAAHEDDEEVALFTAPAPKAAPAAPKAKPAAPKAVAAPIVVDEDDEDEAPAPKAKSAPAPKGKAAPAVPAAPAPAAVSTDVPADLAGLLEDWGEE